MDTLELNTRFAEFDSGAIRIFVCYSRIDSRARSLVIDCLEILGSHQNVKIWLDEKIVLGDVWRESILEAIRRSNCALLIISRHWFDSSIDTTFIRNVELPAIVRRMDNPIDRLQVLPLIVDDTPLSALESLGLQNVQAMVVRIAASKKAVSVHSLRQMRGWLSTIHVVSLRRQVRKSFVRRLVYAALLVSVLIGAFRPGEIVTRLRAFREFDSRVGIEALDATMSDTSDANTQYRAQILRSVTGKHFELIPPGREDAPIITTAKTAIGQSPDRTLWVDLEAGVTGMIAAPSDAKLIIRSQEHSTPPPPGGLMIMTLFEYYSQFFADFGTGAFVLFVAGFIVATIRNRVADDHSLYATRHA